MAVKYTYSIASDFPSSNVQTSKLDAEIAASAIATALNGIDVSGDVIDLWFVSVLSAGDKTILDGDTSGPAGGLIAAHDNTAFTMTNDPAVMTRDPGIADDASKGIVMGHRWINSADDKVFTCADPTEGAAVWVQALRMPGYIRGAKLGWGTVAQATIGETSKPSCASDSTDTFLISWSGKLTADITVSGAGGLDTGAEANNRYAVFAIGDTTGVNASAALLSLSATDPTMPSGYDRFRRLGWVVNDAGDLLKFTQHGTGPTRRIIYDESRSTLEVLSTDSSTGWNSLSLATYMPSTSQYAFMFVSFEVGTSGADGDNAQLRPEGSTVTNPCWQYRPTNGVSTVKGTWPTEWIPTDSLQRIEHGVTQGGASQNQLTMSVMGYEDDL